MSSSGSGENTPKFVIIDSQVNVLGKDAGKHEEQKVLSKPVSKEIKQKIAHSTDVDGLKKYETAYSKILDLDVLNAFRNLRMSLQSNMKNNNSVILVSTIIQCKNSSFASLNLASAFTLEQGKSAILIDCILSQSQLAKELGVNADVGLYEYLTGEEDEKSNLVYSSNIPKLSVISNCRSSLENNGFLEVFAGSRMKELIEYLQEKNSDQVIILNCPPVIDSVDTKILAEFCDNIVIALPYGAVTPAKVDKTINEFGKNNITGFVMIN